MQLGAWLTLRHIACYKVYFAPFLINNKARKLSPKGFLAYVSAVTLCSIKFKILVSFHSQQQSSKLSIDLYLWQNTLAI